MPIMFFHSLHLIAPYLTNLIEEKYYNFIKKHKKINSINIITNSDTDTVIKIVNNNNKKCLKCKFRNKCKLTLFSTHIKTDMCIL